ncbi:MAG: hypothetical protein K9I94_04340 [Bacteroidales bacterium]|nr:hypothetical protein [Bacteroidales bacterium]
MENEKNEFEIKAIELLDTSLSAPDKPLANNTIFQFDIKLEHRIGFEKNLLVVICTITVLDDSKNKTFGKVRTSCVYEILDLSKFFNDDEKQFDMPENLITKLNSISIATTRGIMFSCFKGTFLHKAILPIVDPQDIKTKNN